MVDNAGHPLSSELAQPVPLDGYPDAVMLGDKLYPYGAAAVRGPQATLAARSAGGAAGAGDPYVGAKTIAAIVNSRMGFVDEDFDFAAHRSEIFKKLSDAATTAAGSSSSSLSSSIRDALASFEHPLFEFLPIFGIEEALSPIGVARYFRQLYFNLEEGVGPLEQAFTIAPLETLEVSYENTLRQIHEEVVQYGTEDVSETATEVKNEDEVSDKVSTMLQRDTSASMSASGSSSTPVWSMSASASADLSTSSQRSRDQASRQLKDVTTRASERLTKSFSVKTRDLQEHARPVNENGKSGARSIGCDDVSESRWILAA
jgi:hypothetical protein